MDKAKIKQAIEACAASCCSECPYQYLNDKESNFVCQTFYFLSYKARKEDENKDLNKIKEK